MTDACFNEHHQTGMLRATRRGEQRISSHKKTPPGLIGPHGAKDANH
jgi:hypothetical protein